MIAFLAHVIHSLICIILQRWLLVHLANSLWFTNDSQLNAIFQSRRSGNPIREYTLKSTYTQTFDFDFVLAARALPVKVDLRAEFEKLKTTERFFHVDFGPH